MRNKAENARGTLRPFGAHLPEGIGPAYSL